MKIIALAFALALAPIPVQARDGWQEHSVCDAALFGANNPILEHCHDWVRRVVRHDTGNSCCGDGDAFVVDRSFVRDGNFYIVVNGQEYLVAPERINDARTDGGANPTGQEVAFIWQGEAVCYFDAART